MKNPLNHNTRELRPKNENRPKQIILENLKTWNENFEDKASSYRKSDEFATPDQRMAKISEWPNSKWMAKFLSFSKQRMAMAIHQIGKIQIGEWPVKTLSLANPNAY